MAICKHCQKEKPVFEISNEDFKLVVNNLCNDSKTLAVAEIKHIAHCKQEEAQKWLDHLLNCPHSWPNAKYDHKVLAIIDQAFGDVPKPEHFTNYTHCDECEEHDNTLRNHTRESIRRSDLGNGGWDPITMSSPEDVGYYFPALARYALQPDCYRDRNWYGSQLLSHLSWDGGSNRLLAWCSTKQQNAVFVLLEHLSNTRKDEMNIYGDVENLNIALNNWKPPD